jgi:hypothetical protein
MPLTRAREKCVLCGYPPRECKPAERGNALFFRCRNEQCGNYVITEAAIRHLNQGHTSNLPLLQSQAKYEKERGKVLRIFMNYKAILDYESKRPAERGL